MPGTGDVRSCMGNGDRCGSLVRVIFPEVCQRLTQFQSYGSGDPPGSWLAGPQFLLKPGGGVRATCPH